MARTAAVAGGNLGAQEARGIDQSVAQARALQEAMYSATSQPVSADRRPSAVGDALLARGDPQTVATVRAYGPYMSAAERDAANRRAARVGAPPLFPTVNDTGPTAPVAAPAPEGA